MYIYIYIYLHNDMCAYKIIQFYMHTKSFVYGMYTYL